MTEKKNTTEKNTEKQVPKATTGRWLMVLVGVVLVAVIAVIAWSLTSRRAPSPQEAQSSSTATNQVPATSTSDTTAANVPATKPQDSPASPAAPVGTWVGQSAPDFTLKDLNGNSVSLHQFRGHVVILDFWASWCPPCRASMPTLDGFAAKYHDKGLVLVGVSLDRSASDASSFLKQNNYHRLIALWESVSASQGVAKTYEVSAIPHTFVIDRDGVIRFVDHPMHLTESFLDTLFK
jgi:peroxiredoxin